MSLNKSGGRLNPKGIEQDATKEQNNLVVRINQDSDDNLQALFDSVLNPGESKRPLQVPFRMRQLPESFFTPPAVNARPPSVVHSRANSADSAYDAGSQPNVNNTTNTVVNPSTATISPPQLTPNKLPICHSRAHSSPASLQQTYSMHMGGNVSGETATCIQDAVGPGYTASAAGAVGFASGASNSGAMGHCIPPDNTAPIQTFHMKQRSYDVVSPIQLQNELGALPTGWEQAKTHDGQIYYLNHTTKTTQWEDPRIHIKQQRVFQETLTRTVNIKNVKRDPAALTENLGPLPEGWEQACTDSGDIYFINHINRTTSWNDPRIPDFLQKSVKAPKSEMNWVNVNQPEKDAEFYKPKPDQNVLTRHSASLQMDPFLSGDNHARQESSDSGLSLSSNTFSVNTEFLSQIDDSMDCINESDNLSNLNGIDCADTLVSSLQLEDNICNEMFSDVHSSMLNTSSTKPENLEWYKIN